MGYEVVHSYSTVNYFMLQEEDSKVDKQIKQQTKSN
jgi:hypothetical protein